MKDKSVFKLKNAFHSLNGADHLLFSVSSDWITAPLIACLVTFSAVFKA